MRRLHSEGPGRVGADKTRLTERAATRFAGSRAKKFLSYYKPYRGLLLADLLCAFIISAAALLLPVCTNFITKNLLAKRGVPGALDKIYTLGAAMLALVALQALCTLFVDYQGHVMGAKMERDMRRELFEHYQKLSFSFYDGQRTGQLMARITNDLLSLGRALSSRTGGSRDRGPGADRGVSHPHTYRQAAHADRAVLPACDVPLRAAFQPAHDCRAQIEQRPHRRYQRARRRFARGYTSG